MLQYSSSAALFSLHTNVRPRVCEALSSALQAVSAANPRYLHCFQRCALKGVPEAIFESMGVVWNRCAAPRRQLSREAGVREAAVCWNATRPYGEACEAILDRSLSLRFKGAMHASDAESPQSKVVQKLLACGAHSVQAPCLALNVSQNPS